MTAGLPGAGIGGLFYLGSALLMPFRQLYGWATGRERPPARSWRVALAQAGLALAMFGCMWATGWSAAWLLRRPWTKHLLEDAGTQQQVHVSPIAMLGLALSVFSLIAVLVAVEVVSVALRPARVAEGAEEDATPRGTSRTAAAASVLLALAALLCDVRPLTAQASPHPRATVAAAPADYAAAARMPQAGAADSASPQLARRLATQGHTDAAIRAYESWLADHPNDATAWRELGRQRQRAGRLAAAAAALERAQELSPDRGTRSRLAAIRVALRPAVEPLVGRSGDSDGTTRWVGGLALDGPVARGRIGARAMRTRASDGASVGPGTADALVGTLRVRPTAALDLDISGGLARTRGTPGATDSITGVMHGNGSGNGNGNGRMGTPIGAPPTVNHLGPTGRIRLRLRGPGSAPSLDLRASTAPVDASASLIAAHVWRDEVGGTLELPIGPFRLRGTGKASALRLDGDRNSRLGYGGGLALVPTPALRLSAQFNHLEYAHQAVGPYFAPRLAETLDAGSYLETDIGDAVSLAADVGAGVARLGRFGEPNGAWGPELRLWSLLSWRAAPGRELRLEAEAYDSRVGEVLALAPAGRWRYASLSASLRLTVP